MSALDDYADVIGIVRKTELFPDDETFGTALRMGLLALADELESLRDDAKLGRLVRRMSELDEMACAVFLYVRRDELPWTVWSGLAKVGSGKTPEAALREALKEQDSDE